MGQGGERLRHTHTQALAQKHTQKLTLVEGQGEGEEIKSKYSYEKERDKYKDRDRERRREHYGLGERGEGEGPPMSGNMVRVRAVHNAHSLRNGKEGALKRMSDVTLTVCDQGAYTLPLSLHLLLH